jgi:hypothetical protein
VQHRAACLRDQPRSRRGRDNATPILSCVRHLPVASKV